MLRLPPELRGMLDGFVRQGYPRETCGLLLGTRSDRTHLVVRVRQARNLNVARAGDRYELDPEDYLAADGEARSSGLEIIGVWHSHPDHPARPSVTDAAAAWPEWSYVIVAVNGTGVEDIRSWRLNGAQFDEEGIES